MELRYWKFELHNGDVVIGSMKGNLGDKQGFLVDSLSGKIEYIIPLASIAIGTSLPSKEAAFAEWQQLPGVPR